MLTDAELDVPNHDFGMAMIGRINARWSIRIDVILFNEALSPHERKHRTIAAIAEAAFEEIDRHREDMGLEPDGVDNQAMLDDLRKGSSVADEPNIAVSRHNFKVIRGYRGEDVARHVRRLAARLEQISHSQSQSPGVLAGEFAAGELIAVGVAMAFEVRKLMKAVEGLKVLKAMQQAIGKIGPKAVILTVAVAMVGILIYLTTSMPKRILGLVFNDTDHDLVVKDWRLGTEGGDRPDSGLYMEHGAVKSFPADTVSDKLDSPVVQIRARELAEDGDDDDSMVYGGIFVCEKVFGFRGAEGLFRFSGLPLGQVVDLIFAVPYSKDNGTYIARGTVKHFTKPELFRKLYDQRRTSMDTGVLFRETSAINSARGGVVSLIATIADEPVKVKIPT